MKRTIFIIALFFILAAPLEASSIDGRTEHGPAARPFLVFSRGMVNVLGMPFAILNTSAREIKIHRWIWPLTVGPRAATEFIVRATSAIQDIAFYPFVVPFTDDISPITEPFGLPEYPWQFE